MILQVIGDVITSAVASAISPVAIVLVILILVSDRARTNAPSFLVGWILGTGAVVSGAVLLGNQADAATDPETQDGIHLIRLLLGLLFLAFAVRTWRHRPRHGAVAEPPKFFATVELMPVAKALGLGLAIATIANPKNLALEIGAGGTIAEAGLTTGGQVVVVAVFTLLASMTFIVPVAAVLVLGDRAMPVLTEVRHWLDTHNTAIMLVLFTLLGVRFVGQGMGIFG